MTIEPFRVLLVAVLTGFLLGVGDLWALAHLSASVSGSINSCLGWASAVLVLGFLLRTHPAYAALAGALMMLVAVEAYYVFAPGLLAPDLSAWDGLSAQYWGVIGVPTGLLFGVLGSWARLGADKLAELVTEIRS
ncbi:MAG: DUF6518 family protein [Marmoricola sp.]